MFDELPNPPWELTEDDLAGMAASQFPEGQHLEYKRSSLLDNRNECIQTLTKEVSAFNNADGGTIIIGIQELGEGELELDDGVSSSSSNSPSPNNTTGGDCSGSIGSLGHNLDSDGTCNLTEPTDLPNTDPLLGPLQDNGGPTETHALLPGSPAIDHIQVADCAAITTDQRGIARPQGTGCDIGAFEVVVIPCALPSSGDWTVGEDCTLEGAAQAPANVIVEAGIALTINTGAALDINFTSFHLLIKSGAKVVIRDGGKIF